MTPVAPITTINDLFLRITAAANPRAVLWQDAAGQWQPLSSDQIYQRVRAIAQAFLDWGAKQGDRIALIGENRWEWGVTDFAALAIGAADVPIYPTLTAEQIAELLRDAGCRIAVVSTLQQFEKLTSIRAETQLEHVVVMDASHAAGSRGLSGPDRGAPTRAAASAMPCSTQLVRSISPDDLATLIYTSGTTGEPKGVALTHGNIASNQNLAAADFDFDSSDCCISFLPLSHITARALDYVMYNYGAQVAYCSQFDKLPLAMRQVRPTIIVGVPRVYEKIRQEVERRAALSLIKKRMLLGALEIGSNFRDIVYDGRGTGIAALEAGQQADLLQGARGLRRARSHLHLRRSAAGHRYREVVRLGGHCALGGLRPDRNLSCDLHQLAHASPHGFGGHAAEQCGAEAGRRRRTAGARTFDFFRLLAQARSQCRSIRRAGMVSHRRHCPHRFRRLPLHHRPQEGAAQDLGRQAGGAAAHRKQAKEQPAGGQCGAGRRPAQIHLPC